MDLTRTTAIGRYAAEQMLDGYGPINPRFGETNRDPNQLAQIIHPNRQTILSNRTSPNDAIAIYDTRTKDDLYMEKSTGSTQMLQDLKRMNQEKIVYEEADLLPHPDIPQYNLNSTEMERLETRYKNPYFELDQKSDLDRQKPALIDSRIRYHTNDREYAEEADMMNNALNLSFAPSRYEMLERQNEADRKLLGESQPMNRYIENANAYTTRDMNLPVVSMKDEITHRLEEDRYAINHGNAYFETAQKREQELALMPIPNAQTNDLKYYNQALSGNSEMLHSRFNNYYTWGNDNRENIQENYRNRMHMLDTIASRLDDSYERIYHEPIPNTRKYGETREKEITYFDNSNPYEQKKNLHKYTFIDREVNSTAPPIEGTPASTFINEFGERSMILDAGHNQLILIQKLSPSRIFDGDARSMDDDLLISYLPEDIVRTLRNRMSYSEGRKFREISLNDYLDVTEFVSKNPSVQQRAKLRDVYRLVSDSEIDRRMLDEFSGNRVIVDAAAYSHSSRTPGQEDRYVQYERDLNSQLTEAPRDEQRETAYGYEQAELRGKLNLQERRFQDIDDREIHMNLLKQIASRQDQSLSRDTVYNPQIAAPTADFSRFRGSR